MNRGAASKPVDDQAKLKKVLDELTKREENKFCADCGCRGPRWASINLGVFICIACSGIHRSLGVHLTFVRSVNLDSWTSEQVAQMQKWGNARAKEYYEAHVPRDYRIPTEHSAVREKEQWIRDKYERKRFAARDDDPRAKRRTDSDDGDESDDDSSSSHHRRTGSRSDRRAPPAASGSRTGSSSRPGSSSRTNSSSSRRAEAAAPAPPARPQPATQDILTFDAFGSPPATPQAVVVQPPPPQQQQQQAPKQDEWASFSGSSASSSTTSAGFADAFATPTPATQHVNKMANIMASFGPSVPQQQQMPQMNAFGAGPQGMGGMPMQMGMMGGGGMMGGSGMMGGMNPMMQQPPPHMMMNPMMQQQQQPNAMFGAPMMGGNGAMFPGAAPPMGFPGAPQQMGMAGGMMNPMGGFPQQQQPQFQQFQQQQQHPQQQQQHPQQQQQQNQGGLNQPFVNLGGASGGGGGSNPFF